jgi:negative regulator of flagellin synthesis FlgM
MPTDINGFRPRTLDTNESKATTRPGPSNVRTSSSPDSGAPAASTSDTVHLTDAASRLQQLTGQLANVPEIDGARVNELRQAIADGNYKVDTVHVADKLIALERTLFDAPKR